MDAGHSVQTQILTSQEFYLQSTPRKISATSSCPYQCTDGVRQKVIVLPIMVIWLTLPTNRSKMEYIPMYIARAVTTCGLV
ncbi:hypothetical protein DPMN_125840 [Dreissena polymorpha]|uniref:Uncharacterized protein n=1 Tax=Dreissena polymorpha TaxID=45954 RepID=A0A9D4H267_DREPO|nr:hypothetical protein DPMN_125840 [Dreissena polymorpha]